MVCGVLHLPVRGRDFYAVFFLGRNIECFNVWDEKIPENLSLMQGFQPS